MLLRRQCLALGAKQPQRPGDLDSSFMGVDHRVDVATLSGEVRIGQLVFVLGDQPGTHGFRIAACREFLAIQDVDCSLGTHHGDLGRGPRQVEVRTEMLGAHHVVRAAVCLARDHGDLRDRRLRKGVEQLRPVPDDPAELLLGPRQETGHILECQQGNVESIAEAHEPRPLDR